MRALKGRELFTARAAALGALVAATIWVAVFLMAAYRPGWLSPLFLVWCVVCPPFPVFALATDGATPGEITDGLVQLGLLLAVVNGLLYAAVAFLMQFVASRVSKAQARRNL